VQNREELRQIVGVKKQHIAIGENIIFGKGGQINTVFRPKYRPLNLVENSHFLLQYRYTVCFIDIWCYIMKNLKRKKHIFYLIVICVDVVGLIICENTTFSIFQCISEKFD
jgi:hypothetical protein